MPPTRHWRGMFWVRHDDELRSFLSWRRRTRFLRHNGGPLLALVLLLICLQLLWRMPRRQEAALPKENKKVMDALLSQKPAGQ